MILGIGLAVAGGLVLWLLLVTNQNQAPTTSQDLSEEPNLYIQSAEFLEYADDGSLAYKATASSVEHSTLDQSVVLQDIRVEVFTGTITEWELTASEGILHSVNGATSNEEQQRIDLLGEVEVISRDAEAIRLALVGSDIVLFPHQRKLSSDRPVTITNESATFTAPTFEIDLDTNEFQLSSTSEQRVQVVYSTD